MDANLSTPLDPALPIRRRYSDAALAGIPRLLGLLDRNRLSPTYGSFDRSYWHYRTMDFPCGMSQEFCLPLAMAHVMPMPDNPYLGQERMRELALAAIDFARKTSHADGSCDDYFPFERALGAVTFSLYAMAESALLLEDRRPETLEFIARRAKWLATHNESGRLTNHQAFAALALHTSFELTGDASFREASRQYIQIVRDWYHPDEGWYWEYEGADPGYQSCTLGFLAKLYRKTQDETIRTELMEPAATFCAHYMHPDGSYAGEYGSRNTFHFYPHGFELLASKGHGPSMMVAESFVHKALPNGTRYFNDDDRMCAHYLYDWMHAWQDFSPVRQPEAGPWSAPADAYFPKAAMASLRREENAIIINLRKGGVTKITSADGCRYSDTGPMLRLEDGTVLVAHLMDEQNTVRADTAAGEYHVEGVLSRRRAKLATPFRQILFRKLNLTLGRFAPGLMRSVLQKILITGKPRTDWRFSRTIRVAADTVTVSTTITPPPGAARVVEAWRPTDATSIYVANSNTYQRSVLVPWQAWPKALVDQLSSGKAATFEETVSLKG